jgi:glycosyltransferase involved in cell wall biosynthesis
MPVVPLRVLFLHTGNIFGGVESILHSVVMHSPLAPNLEAHFALCHEGAFSQELRRCGAPVHMLPVTRFSRPWTLLQTRRATARLLRELRPDVCVTISTWTQVVFGPPCRSAGIPQVLWMQSRIEGPRWIKVLANRIPPAALLCLSRDTEKYRQGIYPDTAAEVVYPPLPYRSLHATVAPREEMRRQLDIRPDQTVIMQVSRLESWKGHRILFEALAKLRDRPDWICLQVGDLNRPEEQEYINELRALAARLGVTDRIRFLGRRDDVPSLLGAADIYCQANLDAEGFGISFIEACLAGLPLVTTAIGSAPEIVCADDGLLVPVGDASALATALGSLIASREKREAMGKAGLAKAWRICDPARQMNALESFFRKVSASSRKSS